MLEMATNNRTQDRIFQMRVSDSFLMLVDEWRRHQKDLPSRAEAIRRIVVEKTIMSDAIDKSGIHEDLDMTALRADLFGKNLLKPKNATRRIQLDDAPAEPVDTDAAIRKVRRNIDLESRSEPAPAARTRQKGVS